MSQSLVSISVRVYPNAAGNEVVGFSDDVFRVKVAAPPVQGKANRELVAFLGEALGISKNRVSITRGHTTRNKLIAIDGLSEADVKERLLPRA
ncbi:MAG TPA: DUF167 domain-containing protein [Dehalococcoidia bacterium]|nr:DUF167 domain-containing protein [Dehalococcoidia bacterium]